jgi:protein SCO1/2
MTRAVVLAVALGAGVGCGGDPFPPMLGTVPEFRLVDRDGAAFGSAELDGRPWVAGFIFTRCPDVCPAVTTQMKRVQDGLAHAGGAPLVSFSVDPAYDTPERLDEYARRYGATPTWHFLTGDRAAIARLLRDGFKVAFADDGPETNPITHSDRLVLVDGERRIRGYYHGRTEADVDRLIADASRLAAARAG